MMIITLYSKSENTDNYSAEPSCHEEPAQWQCLPDPELFKGLSAEETENWRAYLYTKPKKQVQRLNLRSHLIALYDPFASRKVFRAGRRWCVNVYVGCAHQCKYCYITTYIRKPFEPRPKKDFEKLLQKDLKEIEKLNLHPAPIHISNSTDPFQPIEAIHRHTLFLLREIQAHRKCFTTITMLTKNPAILCESDYLNIIQELEKFQVEVTCPFFRDEIRKYFEPGAPAVESRLKAIEELRKNNITVSLRIDPIFPREPLPKEFFRKSLLKDYGAPQSHTEEDIEQLIQFAAQFGCKSIIVSPLKLVLGRFAGSDLRPDYLKLYLEAGRESNEKIKRGSSYRLPWHLYHHWIAKPRQLGRLLGIPVFYCKNNLLKTD